MDHKKGMNIWTLAVFGIVALITVTGCVDKEKKNGDIGIQTPHATPEKEVIVTPIPQGTSEPGISPGISSSTGSMIEKYDLNKLVSMSDTIAVGEVADILSSRWNTPDGKKPTGSSDVPYTIYTDANIKIGEYLKGPSPLNTEIITVRTLGGTVGQDRQSVEDQPSYNVNERVLIFLKNDNDPRTKDIGDKHFVTVGLIQGKIPILQDNSVIIDGEKMSLDDVRIITSGKGEKGITTI